MTIAPDYINPLLHMLSMYLEAIALAVIVVKTIRRISGKDTKRGNWADCLVGSLLSLSILFLLLLAVRGCQSETGNLGQVFKEILWTFLMLLLHPSWLLILSLILFSFVLRREKQPKSSYSNNKQKAIWFVCTLLIGSLVAVWLHLVSHRAGPPLFLLVLLLWCIIAMLVLFFWFFRRKHGNYPESGIERDGSS